MSKKKPASIYTAVRIPPDLREQAQKRAEADGRSLGNYSKTLIREDLDRAPRLSEQPVSYAVKKARKKKRQAAAKKSHAA
jgi:hypothetical protein